MGSQELAQFELIDNPEFGNAKKRALFCLPMDGFAELLHMARTRKAEINNLCEMPPLSRDQEQYLFRQYNALKYKANILAGKGDKGHYDLVCSRMREVKDVLFGCNVRLIVNFLKKRQLASSVFLARFSDACLFALYAIDRFNFALGFKFSTYCTFAMIRNFATQKQKSQRDERIFFIDPDVFIEDYDMPAQNCEVDRDMILDGQAIAHLFRLANLNKREIKTITESAALFSNKKMTLEEIGRDLRISKERVRQIKVRGIKKLRAAVEKNRTSLEVI